MAQRLDSGYSAYDLAGITDRPATQTRSIRPIQQAAEQILAEEKAGFKSQRNAIEYIFRTNTSSRLLDKSTNLLDLHKNLFHNCH